MGEAIERPEGGLLKGVGGVRLEGEAGHPVLDRIGESTHMTHDRRRTVYLGAHLGETTRLVQRRHEKEVGPSHEAVLQAVGEVELHSDSVGCGRGQLHQGGLVLFFPAAEKDELGVQR